MRTLTVKDVIQAELLKVCNEVTSQLREKQDKKKKKAKYTNKEIARMRELVRAIGWDEAQTNRWMEIQSILHDAPELKETELPLKMFCVFVCETNATSHRYTTCVPYILTSTSIDNQRGLDLDGLDATNFGIKDRPRYATEEEVQYCIRNLNEKQMRYIHASDVFKPIMDTAMSQAVMVDEPANVSDNDDHEIDLPDGRKITVSSE